MMLLIVSYIRFQASVQPPANKTDGLIDKETLGLLRV